MHVGSTPLHPSHVQLRSDELEIIKPSSHLYEALDPGKRLLSAKYTRPFSGLINKGQPRNGIDIMES